MNHDPHDRDTSETSEDDEQETGARGGDESSSADRLPAAPSDDDTPLGDTDQHSSVPSDQ